MTRRNMSVSAEQNSKAPSGQRSLPARLKSPVGIAIICAVVALIAVVSWSAYHNAVDGIAIDEDNFPDSAFRTYVKTFDLNKNGRLTDDEIAKVTAIDISIPDEDFEADDEEAATATESVGTITNAAGVQFFTALKAFNARNNDLRDAVDLSGADGLEQCDVSGNKNLSEITLPNDFSDKKLSIDDGITYYISGHKLKKATFSYNTQYASEDAYEFPNSGWQSAFTYPSLGTNDTAKASVVAAINAAFKADVDAAAANVYDEDEDGTLADAAYQYRNYTVSYFRNGVISVRKDERTTLGGSHVTEATTGIIENVRTGDTIQPETTLGISRSDLETRTTEAVTAFIAKNTTLAYWDGSAASALESLKKYMTEGKISYYAVSDGIVACIPTYCLGDSSAGHPEVFIAAFNESTATHKPGDTITTVEGPGSATEGTMTVGVRQ